MGDKYLGAAVLVRGVGVVHSEPEPGVVCEHRGQRRVLRRKRNLHRRLRECRTFNERVAVGEFMRRAEASHHGVNQRGVLLLAPCWERLVTDRSRETCERDTCCPPQGGGGSVQHRRVVQQDDLLPERVHIFVRPLL